MFSLPMQLTAETLNRNALNRHPTAFGEPFGLVTEQVTTGALVVKWHQIRRSMDEDRQTLKTCGANRPSCSNATLQFLSIVKGGRSMEGRARLGEINRAINLKIRPMSDLAIYGQDDVWNPPLTTFALSTGDCEDYAFAKYVALQEAGVAAHDLRIVILRDNLRQTHHAVLSARLSGNWLMLDNRVMIMLQDHQVRGYQPIFVLYHHGVRLYVAKIQS